MIQTDQARRTARAVLIEWANEQDAWVREIVREVLATRREVTNGTLLRVKETYLAEKELSAAAMPVVPLLGDGNVTDGAAEQLRLTSLKRCRGVNALAEDQKIIFNARMTILYGENASGKTGYVRVLKRLANVRSAEPIIPDIHRPSASTTPEATIRYVAGSETKELTWRGESGVAPFTRISVFDSPAVALHLEDNVTHVYTPADLALFNYTYAAVEGVKHLLEADLAASQPRQNPFITAFTRGTSIYPKIESLGASTSLPDLEQLASVSAADLAEQEALKRSVEALASRSTQGQAEMLRGRRTLLQHLITVATAVGRFRPAAYADAVAAEKAAREQQATAATAVFSAGALLAEAQPAWQRFLQAGEEYLDTSGQTEYPHPLDDCVYCRQPLGDAAVALLTRYRQFASGAVAVAFESASRQTAQLAAVLDGAEMGVALGALESLIPTLEQGAEAPEWAAGGARLVAGVVEIRRAIGEKRVADAAEAQAIAAQLLPQLRAALTETSAALTALEGTVQERTNKLTDVRGRLGTLEARVTLVRLMPEIRAYLERSVWASRVRTLLMRFQGLLRSLTDVTKIASEDVLNKDFERLFYEECDRLRAPTVTLDFPGKRGQAARRKTVSTAYSLPAILSEGEQKVIAIADFLAEASLRSGSAPIVFDDPVTSLDYRRLQEVVKRVSELAEKHQVIVFTHNPWFASDLLSAFENHPSNCTFYEVVDRGGHKGVVIQGSHPRFDTINQVKGRINSAIQTAKAASAADQTGQVEAAYDHIRVWCELVVEGELLAKVTQRHQPNVAMTNLERIKPEHLKAAIAIILPTFEKACRYIPGHSQPIDMLGVRPTVQELIADWAALQDALKNYQAS